MTDHFFFQNNKSQPTTIVKEEPQKSNINNQNNNHNNYNSKKPKLSHKVVPEKQISLYSLNEHNLSKEKTASNKNKPINTNNNSSNLSQFNQSNQHQTNGLVTSSEGKDFKSKKSFESPLHQTKKFNAKTGVTKTSKETFNEYKPCTNDPLASPIHNTANSNIGLNSHKFSNSKMSNSNLPISTIPKAKINMSPSSTTHKSIDSNLSQSSIYHLKRSEKSDEEMNKNSNLINYNTSQLANKNNSTLFDQANYNSNNLAPNNNLILLNTSNSVNVNNKKSNDFKLKYKTEKCKFWELYKECKYGDNVSFLIFFIILVRICSWNG